jgi:hypothetical protein
VERLKSLVLSVLLGLLLTLAVSRLASWATPQTTPQSINSGQHFLPPFGNARDRLGFDSGTLTGYDVAQLNAGWYSNWGASLNPDHPDHLVYAQLIRFHAGADPHDPAQVTVNPSKATIAQIAAAQPGSLWLMSNEPDSFYQGDPILPEVYAVVYHDFYAYIKDLDPTALIANGGIVQPTPCRLEYLDIVWDTFLNTYDEPMPVDVWNIHAFVLREVYKQWGASTPPGVDPSCGIAYTVDDSGDMDIFWNNIRAMRTWMKEKGQQDKPLIISEYGILWPQWFAAQYTPQRVSYFMTQTFDLFLYETDPEIGYAADDYRLVQTWAWYSLSDDQQYNGYLFNSGNKTLSLMGRSYASYTAALSDTLYADLSVRLLSARPGFTAPMVYTGTVNLVTVTTPLTWSIGNLGKLSVPHALARLEIAPGQGGSVIFGRDTLYTVPARFEGVIVLPPLTVTLAGPDYYDLRLSLDPEDQVEEPREWNNVATTTLDLRPDLTPQDLVYHLSGPIMQSGTLAMTATAYNQGIWPTPAVSATAHLETKPGSTLGLSKTLLVPPLGVGDQVSLAITFTWPAPDRDLYHLIFQLDEANYLKEQSEDNNESRQVIPVVLSTTLSPGATTILTSTSGALQFIFPAGAVTTPTQIIYTPIWPADWVSGGLRVSSAGFSLTALLNGQAIPLTFAQPVSLTWRYGDADIEGLDEEKLGLFRSKEGGYWEHASYQPYQRDPDQNQLATTLHHTGLFVFGSRYEAFLPLILGTDTSQRQQMAWPALLESDRPRSPLRLP